MRNFKFDVSFIDTCTRIDIRNEIIKNIVKIELTYIEHIQNIYKRKDVQDALYIRNKHRRQDIQKMVKLLHIKQKIVIHGTDMSSSSFDYDSDYNESDVINDVINYETPMYETPENEYYNGYPIYSSARNMKYGIGMLVEDVRDNEVGVIIGWDMKCSSQCNYPFQPCGPFWSCFRDYTVLTCDDMPKSIVSEESLRLLETQKWIDNSDIGRYFIHFEGTHYVPNKRMQDHYPDDVEKLKQKYSKDVAVVTSPNERVVRISVKRR